MCIETSVCWKHLFQNEIDFSFLVSGEFVFFEHTVKKWRLFPAWHKNRATKKKTPGHPILISLQGLVFEELRTLLAPSKSLSLTGAILRAQHLQKTINISHTSTQNPQHTPHPHHTGLSKSIHTQNTHQLTTHPEEFLDKLPQTTYLHFLLLQSSHVKWSQIHCHCRHWLRVKK